MRRVIFSKPKATIKGTVTRLEEGLIILYNQQYDKEFRISADGFEDCVFALISKCKCTVEGSFSILEGDIIQADYISFGNNSKIDLVNYLLHYNKRRKEILVKNSASFSNGAMKGEVHLIGRFGYYKGDIVFYDPERNIIFKSYREETFHYIYYMAKEVRISGNVDSDGHIRVNGISVVSY
jgi:hypothetical protein